MMADAVAGGLVEDATIAQNEGHADAFWLLRDSISGANRAIGPAMQHDVSVPVADMADFVIEATPLIEGRFPGTRAIAYGHLGDGNIHFHVLAPTGAVRGEWEWDEGKRISAYVHDLVTQWGGSISAEHGNRPDEARRIGPIGRSGGLGHVTRRQAGT